MASQLIDHINSNGLNNKNQSTYKAFFFIKRGASAVILLDQSVVFVLLDQFTFLS